MNLCSARISFTGRTVFKPDNVQGKRTSYYVLCAVFRFVRVCKESSIFHHFKQNNKYISKSYSALLPSTEVEPERLIPILQYSGISLRPIDNSRGALFANFIEILFVSKIECLFNIYQCSPVGMLFPISLRYFFIIFCHTKLLNKRHKKKETHSRRTPEVYRKNKQVKDSGWWAASSTSERKIHFPHVRQSSTNASRH